MFQNPQQMLETTVIPNPTYIYIYINFFFYTNGQVAYTGYIFWAKGRFASLAGWDHRITQSSQETCTSKHMNRLFLEFSIYYVVLHVTKSNWNCRWGGTLCFVCWGKKYLLYLTNVLTRGQVKGWFLFSALLSLWNPITWNNALFVFFFF